jgi:hypothetical protein
VVLLVQSQSVGLTQIIKKKKKKQHYIYIPEKQNRRPVLSIFKYIYIPYLRFGMVQQEVEGCGSAGAVTIC